MSDTSNYRGQPPISVGYTQAEIEARAVSKSPQLWKVRCLNGSDHKNDDSHPSAFYYPDTGWYGCNVCGKQGIASDRLYSAQKQKVNGQQPQRSGSEQKEFLPDRIPPAAKLTATYLYRRTTGRSIHRVRRYDWVDDATGRQRKEYLPQHFVKGEWKHGTGRTHWQPYNADEVASASVVYVVEGEKCADTLGKVATEGTVVITSAFGTNSAWKTDWSCLHKRIEPNDCEVVFIPDCDAPGEKYIHSVAWELKVATIKVVRIGDVGRNDGYDVADWLTEGKSWKDLPAPTAIPVRSKEEFEEQKQRTAALSNGKPQLTRETAYEREIGNLTVDERIERNRSIEPQRINWLINQYVAVGQTTIIFGKSGRGKTTIVRSLVRHIVEGTDPFASPNESQASQSARGRALWWLGEEDVALTKPKFTAAELELDDIDLLDRGHKWRCDDVIEIKSDGVREFVDVSPHTQLLNRIDQASQQGQPYSVIVIDPLSTMLGETNKSEVFEKRWDETVVTLESRGLAVIAIMHPRKDDPINSPLEASLRGTERLFSLPRLIAHVQSETTKELLRQSKEFDDGVTHANPIRDRFNGTGNGQLHEDKGSIGVLSPLKNSHIRPEQLLAWQYSLVNVNGGRGANQDFTGVDSEHAEEEAGVGVAEFSRIPWRPADIGVLERDGKSFGSAIASKYELVRREKQTKQEQLAAAQLDDRAVESETVADFLNGLFDRKARWSTSDFEDAVKEQGYSYSSGAFVRARTKIAEFSRSRGEWSRKNTGSISKNDD